MPTLKHTEALKKAHHKIIQDQIKLRAAKALYRKRKSIERRNNDIEWRRIQERNWHRKKSGKSLDDPVRKQKSPKT